jgi:hypothetical protein
MGNLWAPKHVITLGKILLDIGHTTLQESRPYRRNPKTEKKQEVTAALGVSCISVRQSLGVTDPSRADESPCIWKHLEVSWELQVAATLCALVTGDSGQRHLLANKCV